MVPSAATMSSSSGAPRFEGLRPDHAVELALVSPSSVATFRVAHSHDLVRARREAAGPRRGVAGEGQFR